MQERCQFALDCRHKSEAKCSYIANCEQLGCLKPICDCHVSNYFIYVLRRQVGDRKVCKRCESKV